MWTGFYFVIKILDAAVLFHYTLSKMQSFPGFQKKTFFLLLVFIFCFFYKNVKGSYGRIKQVFLQL